MFEERGQTLWRIAARGEPRDQVCIRAVRHVLPPEIVHHLRSQCRVVAQEFLRKRHAGTEGGLAERTLTKPVDRENGGFIEALQCALQRVAQ